MVKPLLPPQQGKGQLYRNHRTLVNTWFGIHNAGSPWQDLPKRFGPWKTMYSRFNRWRAQGLIDRILEALQVRLDADGQINWDLWCVDSSLMRAHVAAVVAGEKGDSQEPDNHALVEALARRLGHQGPHS